MSDYEKINVRVKKNTVDMRILAFKKIIVVLIKVLLALAVFIGLNAINFISVTFMVILMAAAIVYGAYKVGSISNEIKF